MEFDKKKTISVVTVVVSLDWYDCPNNFEISLVVTIEIIYSNKRW